MNYPPFKHFTLMEQTPTTASDSATPLQKVFAEVSDMTLPELADYVLELREENALVKELHAQIRRTDLWLAESRELLRKARYFVLNPDSQDQTAMRNQIDDFLSPDKTA